jgi:hypothetical protein
LSRLSFNDHYQETIETTPRRLRTSIPADVCLQIIEQGFLTFPAEFMSFGRLPIFYCAYRRVVGPRLAARSATEEESVFQVLSLGPIGGAPQLFSAITSLEIGYDNPQIDELLTGALDRLDQLQQLTWRVESFSRQRIESIGQALNTVLVQHRRTPHHLSTLTLIVSSRPSS